MKKWRKSAIKFLFSIIIKRLRTFYTYEKHKWYLQFNVLDGRKFQDLLNCYLPFILLNCYLAFCHKNEMESRKFLRKLNYYTRGNFKFFTFWQTRKIESLFKLKGKNFHPSHVVYRGICNCGVEYVGETARNLEVRVKEHENISKQSEPARHLYSNPSHFFTWNSLRTVHSFVKRRIVEALFITTMNPELNKQVQSYELILFPKGIGIT